MVSVLDSQRLAQTFFLSQTITLLSTFLSISNAILVLHSKTNKIFSYRLVLSVPVLLDCPHSNQFILFQSILQRQTLALKYDPRCTSYKPFPPVNYSSFTVKASKLHSFSGIYTVAKIPL